MIKVYQDEFTTLTPDGTKRGNGNCLTACLASLFEVPLHEVARIQDCPPDGSWFRMVHDWVRTRGQTFDHLRHEVPEGYSIASGPSPRGPWDHSVIYWKDQLLHDPHPEGGGLKSVSYYMVFRPLNPDSAAGDGVVGLSVEQREWMDAPMGPIAGAT